MLVYAVVFVLCSLVVACRKKADLLAVVYIEFSCVLSLSQCVLVHILIRGEFCAVKLGYAVQ